VKGFDEKQVFLNSRRWCTIYLNVVFYEQIKIGSRYVHEWHITKFGIPWYKRSLPPDTEAAAIGSFLGLPVNTISYLTTASVIQNFYNPRDKMAPLMQRPTQEQLDHERDNPPKPAPIQSDQ
jgi:hypothetical protein